jgi:hypothetical protein
MQRYQSKLLRTITNAPWYVHDQSYTTYWTPHPVCSPGHPWSHQKTS